MSTRENVHLSILRQRILIRKQNSPVKRSRENVHQPRIWTPNSLHLAPAVGCNIRRETQYTGPGHGIDAHVADRARLHARVFNCTTQLQRVLDSESFDLVPSHAGEKITNANTNRTRELERASCMKSKKGVRLGNTPTTMDFGTTNKTLRQRGTAGRPKDNALMPES